MATFPTNPLSHSWVNTNPVFSFTFYFGTAGDSGDSRCDTTPLKKKIDPVATLYIFGHLPLIIRYVDQIESNLIKNLWNIFGDCVTVATIFKSSIEYFIMQTIIPKSYQTLSMLVDNCFHILWVNSLKNNIVWNVVRLMAI